jgi:hypothetical protein
MAGAASCDIQMHRISIQTAQFAGVIMASARRRKNLFIDQRRIDRVKALLNVDTETEAIDRALALVEDLAQFEADVDRGLAGLVGKGGFVDRFPSKAPSR